MSSIIGGKKTSEHTVGSQQTSTQFRPEDAAALQQQMQAVQAQNQGVTTLTGQLQNQARTQGAPTLAQSVGMQQFTPQFSNAPDAMSRALVSQGTQGLNQQAATQQQALQRSLAGSPGVASVLGRQAAMQSRLQANPLQFQAAQQQAGRELGQQQLGLQAAGHNSQNLFNQFQLQNQAALQQAQANQANRAEQLGYGQAGMAANQALLSNLSQLAQQFGTQNTNSEQNSTQRSGGIAQNFGIK